MNRPWAILDKLAHGRFTIDDGPSASAPVAHFSDFCGSRKNKFGSLSGLREFCDSF
jgi:hypothetical protein